MSRFVVNLNESSPEEKPSWGEPDAAPSGFDLPKTGSVRTKKPSGCVKLLAIGGALLALVLLIGGIGGYFYWQSVKATPAYSLALIVDAARRDDKEKIEQLLNTDQVVSGFIPQITDKAVELYGRNLPAKTIAKVSQVAAPLIPAVKERVRAELPRLIREKTQPVESVPYWLIALFASRAIDVKQEGDTATVTSKLADRPLEVTMKRNGEIWQIVAVKDDVLAKQIAEKIGQEIIAAASKGGIDKIGKQAGVNNLGDVFKNIDGILK